MEPGFFRRLMLAFIVPYRWDQALRKIGSREFEKALMILESVEPPGSYRVYKPLMGGHCYWEMGSYEKARELFEEVNIRLSSSEDISETDKAYLRRYVAAHDAPQLEVSREGVSPFLLRWFTVRG